MTHRLGSIAPDLLDELEAQSERRLRRTTAAIVRLAVTSNDLTEEAAVAGLAALQHGRFGETEVRSAVISLAERLDNVAWDLQEDLERGSVFEDAYLTAFRRARAAACLGFALDSSAISAALEAIYEAQAALGSLDKVRGAVRQSLAE